MNEGLEGSSAGGTAGVDSGGSEGASGGKGESIIEQLRALSEIDSKIAISLERSKELEQELKERREAIGLLERAQLGKSNVAAQAQARFSDEESQIKGEREKLVARRKALSTHNNYKLQQSAEKEITFNSRELDKREELLIETMAALEGIQAEAGEIKTKLLAEREAFGKREAAILDELNSAASEVVEFKAKRTSVAAGIDKAALAQYARVQNRYKTDPLVAVLDNRCAGCHMQLVPQVTVRVLTGVELVKCPGCSRILYCQKS